MIIIVIITITCMIMTTKTLTRNNSAYRTYPEPCEDVVGALPGCTVDGDANA